LLLEGYLYNIGISEEKIQSIIKWRDGLFRELAESYSKASSDLAVDLINSSYQGGKQFELAVAAMLKDMGFHCERDGASGEKDIILVATIGPDSYKLTFEAKGSQNTVPNDAAEVAGAASHRSEVGA